MALIRQLAILPIGRELNGLLAHTAMFQLFVAALYAAAIVVARVFG